MPLRRSTIKLNRDMLLLRRHANSSSRVRLPLCMRYRQPRSSIQLLHRLVQLCEQGKYDDAESTIQMTNAGIVEGLVTRVNGQHIPESIDTDLHQRLLESTVFTPGLSQEDTFPELGKLLSRVQGESGTNAAHFRSKIHELGEEGNLHAVLGVYAKARAMGIDVGTITRKFVAKFVTSSEDFAGFGDIWAAIEVDTHPTSTSPQTPTLGDFVTHDKDDVAIPVMQVLQRYIENCSSDSDCTIPPALGQHTGDELLVEFNSWPSRTNPSWNLESFDALLRAYGRSCRVADVERLRSYFAELGIQPSLSTFNTLLAAYADTQRADLMQQVRQDMQRQGLTPNVLTFNAFVKLHARRLEFDRIRILRTEMQRLGVQPDAATFSYLAAAYTYTKDLAGLRRVHKEMEVVGVEWNTQIFNATMQLHAARQDWQAVEYQWQKMLRSKVQPDVVTFNTLIFTHAARKKFDRVEELVADMKAAGFVPNSSTIKCLVTAYRKAGDVGKLLLLHGELQQFGMRLEVKPFNSLIIECIGGQQFEKLDDIWSRMQAAGIKPDIDTYEALIRAYSQGQHVVKALDIYKDMKEALLRGLESERRFPRRCQPLGDRVNTHMFNALIDACGECGMLSAALQLKADMQDFALEPNVVTFNRLLHICAKEDDVQSLLEVKREMWEKGVKPNVATFNILLRPLNHPEAAALTETFREEMRSMCVSPNLLTFTTLIRTCAAHQSVQRLRHLVQEMEREGVLQDPAIQRALARAHRHVELAAEGGEEALQGVLGSSSPPRLQRRHPARADPPNPTLVATPGAAPVAPSYPAGATQVQDGRLSPKGASPAQRDRLQLSCVPCNDVGQLPGQPQPHTASCHTVIAGFATGGNVCGMREVWEDALRAGIVPEAQSFNVMIATYAKSNRLALVDQVRADMTRVGVQPTIVTFNALIRSYGGAQLLDRVEGVRAEMHALGVRPDAATFGTLMHVFADAGQWDALVRLQREMQQRPDSTTAEAILRLHAARRGALLTRNDDDGGLRGIGTPTDDPGKLGGSGGPGSAPWPNMRGPPLELSTQISKVVQNMRGRRSPA